MLRYSPYLLALTALEIGWYFAAEKRPYPWSEAGTSLAIFLMRIPERIARVSLLAPVWAYLWQFRLATVRMNNPWDWALLFLAVEFCHYWAHRGGHRIRWMWATHAVHHSPSRIHLASAVRLGVTGLLSGEWLFYLPLALIGFPPAAVTGMLVANLLYQFWLHTDVIGRLGPLEWVFNTPSNHRVHHASNAGYLDRNFGGVLMIWDHLFGTYAAERHDVEITYGLVHPIESGNPLIVTFHQWRQIGRRMLAAGSVKEKARYLFGPP